MRTAWHRSTEGPLRPPEQWVSWSRAAGILKRQVNFTQRAALRAMEGKREKARLHFCWAPTVLRVCRLTHGVQTTVLFKKPSQICSKS